MRFRNRTAPTLVAACRRGAHRIWARQDLTAQERADLLAGWTPPAVVSASLGGRGVH
ncbi:hypothetical protein [Nocardia brasiliensis]|uniref:hypothetical protein n=1 Tax=Nocardia brasiliensis TaxID=37326 RepID=UPI00142E7CEE|nr:hypothetical protein [Nocardia brasiliensis]